jgi:lipopolysaccharide transport system ATP-binding protein
MKPAIRVDNLSKQYRIGAKAGGEYRTLRESLMDTLAAPIRKLRGQGQNGNGPDRFWALKDVSFEVQPGEVVGIIGRNGAGKSTLLKILSRIVEPTRGRAKVRGRMSSLLEVGTGFHQELTGRENIYLNGSILGMSRREIRQKFDEIVAFSEIEQFLDTPVKRYSSGMYVRLAFAVAAHLEPEILAVDEVLAVGDAAFQRKCFGKLNEVVQSGRTILLVSHNMGAIRALSTHIVLLSNGKLQYYGGADEGIRKYMQSMADHTQDVDLLCHPKRRSNMIPVLRKVRFLDNDCKEKREFACGEDLTIELEVDPFTTKPAAFGIGFEDQFGTRAFSAATYLSTCKVPRIDARAYVRCTIERLPLAPGQYRLSLSAGGPAYEDMVDNIEDAITLDVVPGDFYRNGRLPTSNLGNFLVPSIWKLERV